MEFFLFWFLKDYYPNIILLNISIRASFVLLSASIIKKNVFNGSKNFYSYYYLITSLNPFLSSLCLLLFSYLLPDNLLISKFFADLFVSYFSFYLLKKL